MRIGHLTLMGLHGVILVLAGVIVFLEFFVPGELIEDTHGEASVSFSVDRRVQVFRQVNVECHVDPPAHVRLQDESAPYAKGGMQSIAGESEIELQIIFPDGTEKKYKLEVTVLFATPWGWAILIALTSSVYLAGRLQGFIPGLRAFMKSLTSVTGEVLGYLKETLSKEDRAHLLGLLAVLAFAIWIRCYYLDQPLRLDEATTLYRYAGPEVPLTEGLSNYSAPNNHLLNTLIMHLSIIVFQSTSLWALRLAVVIAGILLVAAIYLVGRLYYNKNAALLAAGMAAASAPMILFSTNARGYSYVFLFFMVLLALAHPLRRKSSAAGWTLFTLAAVLGFYAIPIMLYPFLIVALWLAVSMAMENPAADRGPLIRSLLAASITAAWFTVLLYIPVIVKWGLEGVISNPFIASAESMSEFATNLWAFLGNLKVVAIDGSPPSLSIALLSGVLISIVFHKRLANHRVQLAWATIITLAVVLLLQRPLLRFPRILLFLFPLYLVIAGAGVYFLISKIIPAEKHRRFIFPLLVIAAMVWNGVSIIQSQSVTRTFSTGRLPHAEEITLLLKDRLEAGDRVVPPKKVEQAILRYYFERHGMERSHVEQEVAQAERIFVILVPWPRTITPNDILFRYLTKEKRWSLFGRPKLIHDFKEARLYEVERKAASVPGQ
jgi:hypothetical protein